MGKQGVVNVANQVTVVPAVHSQLTAILSDRLSSIDRSVSYLRRLEDRILSHDPAFMSLEQTMDLYKLLSSGIIDTLELVRKFGLNELLSRLEAVELYQYLNSLDVEKRAKLKAFLVGATESTRHGED